MRSSRIFSLVAITGALLSTSALAMHRSPLPAHPGSWHYNPAHQPFQAPKANASGTWNQLTHAFPGTGDTSLLLTDGTVIMHDLCTVNWFKLTPDNTGSYKNGTWTSIAAMPSGYSPLYFGSAVMPDGQHVMVEGGEYLNCNAVWTNKGAIYDTVANTWTNVPPPTGWTKIGDAQSVVRTDGLYMQADCCTSHSAIGTISGNTVTWSDTAGTGKGDVNDEEGWTQLPEGTVLPVDPNRALGSNNAYEIIRKTRIAGHHPAKSASPVRIRARMKSAQRRFCRTDWCFRPAARLIPACTTRSRKSGHRVPTCRTSMARLTKPTVRQPFSRTETCSRRSARASSRTQRTSLKSRSRRRTR